MKFKLESIKSLIYGQPKPHPFPPSSQTKNKLYRKKGAGKSALGNERKLKLSWLIKGIISLEGISQDKDSTPNCDKAFVVVRLHVV